LRGVAIQDSVGINSVFLPVFPVPCSLFPCHNDKFSRQPTYNKTYAGVTVNYMIISFVCSQGFSPDKCYHS
jgi:hypothetical protein